jgi:hypothetical protein
MNAAGFTFVLRQIVPHAGLFQKDRPQGTNHHQSKPTGYKRPLHDSFQVITVTTSVIIKIAKETKKNASGPRQACQLPCSEQS